MAFVFSVGVISENVNAAFRSVFICLEFELIGKMSQAENKAAWFGERQEFRINDKLEYF